MKDLKELRALCDAATDALMRLANTPMNLSMSEWCKMSSPIRDLAKKTPALIDEVERLRAVLEELTSSGDFGLWVGKSGLECGRTGEKLYTATLRKSELIKFKQALKGAGHDD